MRNYIYAACVIVVSLYMSGGVNAIPISESVYATIGGASGGGAEIEVGDMVHLFDAAYDNEGDVTYIHPDETECYIEQFDDATFTLSTFLTGLVHSYGGGDAPGPDNNEVYYYDGGGCQTGMVYRTVYDDYSLSFSTDWTGSSYGNFYVYDASGSYLNVSFNDPSSVTGGPIEPVPEPATMLLLGAGLAGFAGFGRKKNNEMAST